MSTRRAAVFAAIVTLTIGMSVGAAGAAHPRIGPNQEFVGLVNGSTGQHDPAVIAVACPGPIHPGETTHPLAHQTLEVNLPPSSGGSVGNTGPDATHITAYLGIPPSGAASSSGLPTFWHYGKSKPIPTSLTVPCSGKGYITFIPWPRVPGQTIAFVVPIEYANIAV